MFVYLKGLSLSNKIFASILSADFANLGEDIANVIQAGASGIHFDVMDNHFVPNLTIGPDVCRSLRNYGIDCFIDVHLMVSPLNNLVPMFAQAGADAITFHIEAVDDPVRTINQIKDLGCKVGVAISPKSDSRSILSLIDSLDSVLIMSVEPGFGGQAFLPSAYEKIRFLKDYISSHNLPCVISVDGGVNLDNIGSLVDIGTNNFVIGSALFKENNYSKTLKSFWLEINTN
jgi:ribulose-phosphate 3-epimerase